MRIAITAAVLLVATAAEAEDDKPEYQHMRLIESGEFLTVSTEWPGGIGKVFDVKAYDALANGISSTLVIRIQITPQGSDTPVAEQLIQRSVIYDVWDEVYSVQLDEPAGRKTLKSKSRAEAFKQLIAIQDLPVARLDALLPYGKIFVLRMVIELNPVSKETLAEVRRWLSRGNGGGLERGGAFFGSFVSVFYNPKIAEADRILRIYSQPFYREST